MSTYDLYHKSRTIIKFLSSHFIRTMTDAPDIPTVKQKTTLARIERQKVNIARIETANNRFYEEQAAEVDLTPDLLY